MSNITTPANDHDHEPEIEFSTDMPGPELVRIGKELIAQAQRQMIETNAASTGRAASARFSRFHDQLLKAMHRHFIEKWEAEGRGSPGSLCIVALGGYGRRELALRSDVDLLFLIAQRKGQQEAFIKEFLHTLFDLGLDLGYAVRRMEDCTGAIGKDLESTTAMMESRFIAGSKPLFQQYHENFYAALRGSGRKWLMQTQFRDWHVRRQKYDSSVYLLEPNIKEGTGGLRDIHSVQWLLAIIHDSNELVELERLGVLSPAEVRQYRSAEDFILKLRNELHSLSPRKNDVLNFDAQIEISRRLRYEETDSLLPEEVLMREYYSRARQVARFSSRAFLALTRGEPGLIGSVLGSLQTKRINKYCNVKNGAIFLDPKNENYLSEDRQRIMDLFLLAQQQGLHVSEKTLDRIEKMVPDLGDEFRESPRCRDAFMEMLKGPWYVAQTLSDMHDCGLLSAYLPEFERIHCMVRIDHYHRYTVDEHLIKAVGNFEVLLREPENLRSHVARIASEIEERALLNFSLLVHDVGKGEGKGHALRGGQIVQRIGDRIGLKAEQIDVLRFLVLSHLKMGHVAQRRDPDDPKVGRDIAEEVGSLERLKLLYVHSVCDVMAVSPDAWTEWKAQLYEAAYRAGALALQAEPAENEAPPSQRPIEEIAARIWEHLKQSPAGALPADAEERDRFWNRLEGFVRNVPRRYLQTLRIEIIAKHFVMIQKLNDDEQILWELEPGLGVSELTVCAADVPGAFGYVCGALAAKDINILSAQIFSTSDGYAINDFQVTDLRNQPLPEGFRLDRVRNDLNQVFLGNKTMAELMEKHKTQMGGKRVPRNSRPTEIGIDNEGSQEFTILEVRTGDRPGLLYRIASSLTEHRLNIHRALVTTEAYGAFDVFYVTDFEYNKIHDKERIAGLKSDLIAALDADVAVKA